MGTRSVTIFMRGNREMCRIYRQYDGNPEGHGVDLARALDREITNGVTCSLSEYKSSNGLEELVIHAITALKQANWVGNIYMETVGDDIDDWIEYVYTVKQLTSSGPVYISCSTHTGQWPFNMQEKDKTVFSSLTPKQVIEQYSKERVKA